MQWGLFYIINRAFSEEYQPKNPAKSNLSALLVAVLLSPQMNMSVPVRVPCLIRNTKILHTDSTHWVIMVLISLRFRYPFFKVSSTLPERDESDQAWWFICPPSSAMSIPLRVKVTDYFNNLCLDAERHYHITGLNCKAHLFISGRAHLLFDSHQIVDGLNEVELGGSR